MYIILDQCYNNHCSEDNLFENLTIALEKVKRLNNNCYGLKFKVFELKEIE